MVQMNIVPKLCYTFSQSHPWFFYEVISDQDKVLQEPQKFTKLHEDNMLATP